MKFLISIFIIFFSIMLNSCGKAESYATNENECEYRLVAGQECIVCSKGGVSCKW